MPVKRAYSSYICSSVSYIDFSCMFSIILNENYDSFSCPDLVAVSVQFRRSSEFDDLARFLLILSEYLHQKAAFHQNKAFFKIAILGFVFKLKKSFP